MGAGETAQMLSCSELTLTSGSKLQYWVRSGSVRQGIGSNVSSPGNPFRGTQSSSGALGLTILHKCRANQTSSKSV